MKQGPYYSLAIEITELIQVASTNGHLITFQWIPAHCGVMGNEEADAEAKNALSSAPEVRIAFSRADTNALLRCVMRSYTLQHWTKPERRHQRLHKWDPEMRFRMPPKLKRQLTSMIHRIRLGVAYTRRYAHIIGRSDTGPNCEHCDVPETLEHIFCVCPAYARERQTLISSTELYRSRSLTDETMLGPWPDTNSATAVTRAVITFLETTGLCARL